MSGIVEADVLLPEASLVDKASDSVAEMDAHHVAREIVAILGRPMVALITGVSATRVVRRWEEEGEISKQHEQALRLALQCAFVIKTRFKSGVVHNWMGGHNSFLGDRAPGELIQSLTKAPLMSPEASEIARKVLGAARTFITR